MSYSCREFIRTLNLSRFEMTVTPVLPRPTNATGPQPSLIDVFKRHPKWKRRVKYLLSHPEVVVPGDKAVRRKRNKGARHA